MRPRKNAPASSSLTKLLDRLESKVREVHIELKADFATVTPVAIKQSLIQSAKTGGSRETFVQYFDRYITMKSTTHSKATVGVYKSALRNLKLFRHAKDFNDITPEWFDRYKAYMESYRDNKVTEKSLEYKRTGYSQNYIAKQCKIFKDVLTAARKAGLHHNEKFADGSKIGYEDTDAIYLTQDELIALHRAELSPTLSNVRDRFLLGAFTLLRFSDFSRITEKDIRDGMVYNKNQKTGANIVVPVHWVVSEIMAKYPEGIPPGISNQKTNAYIKDACRLAGITEPITINKTQGGNIITTVKDKCDLVTTHTARRSGACIMELSGIPRSIIMAMGGWKTESAYLHYIRYKSIDSARIAQDYAFFTKPADPG